MKKDTKIVVIGLGYVGLPLAVAFGKQFDTIGFDVNEKKVSELKKGIDGTGEVNEADFKASTRLTMTSSAADIASGDVFIVAVPTPIDDAHRPDLRPVESAGKIVGQHMKQGSVVVFESTVYPGVTEEICVPILEKASGMMWKKDFHVGYSPERINPGDREHTLERIVKVVSGDDENTLNLVAEVYEAVIKAGVYRVQRIKEAEAAKVIENTQRDLNIALMNELAIIFDRMNIDTENVLKAAGTKWNFLPFRPGLVGGHCIGVDPYYLTYKAEMLGYHPEVILAGRRINDNVGKYVAEKTVKLMANSDQHSGKMKVGILGLTFKEDCPDIRNTKVVDIVTELKNYGINPLVHDPQANPDEAFQIYGLSLCHWDDLTDLNALIIAVAHKEYREKTIHTLCEKIIPNGCMIDVKSILDPEQVGECGIKYWRL